MKKTFLALFAALASTLASAITYEDIVITNADGKVKTVQIKKLEAVKSIVGIRDFRISTNLDYNTHIYIHKLLPPYIATKGCEIQDIQMTPMDVIVDASVYEYLRALKEQSGYEKKYAQDYVRRMYLKDYLDLDDKLRMKWTEILLNNKVNSIEYVPCSENFKMTAEARLIANEFDNRLASKNIQALKSLGYDTVLVRFDTTEDINKLVGLVNFIHNNGMKVFLAYVGLDNQKPIWNPYIEPFHLVTYISTLSPLADGWFLNWRSTSSHVKLLPIEFFNYLCDNIRRHNSFIPIFGEVYYGKIDYIGYKKKLVSTLPANISGIVLNNMGYYGYNYAYIVNKLFTKQVPDYFKLHKVVQVIGAAPYYCSKNDMGLTLEKEYKFKKNVEASYANLNCSTVTLLHDGVDDNFVIEGKYDTCDNILYDEKISNLTTDKKGN